ncbi:unnamed protein product [Phytomonas sp. EM1]|nr:unnamed protein product [Phytomonas sp. EM1]|eukprot:CCW64509.1 unnamed protein product [Phytomonas sp. isolate EM1]
MSNKIDENACYSVGSAYLSGLPVVVAGYKMPFHKLASKIDFMEAAIKNAELHPQDVVIMLDSDTIFTGADLNPFLDHFLAQSAATPEKLDAVAVRQGRAMAPFLVSAEAGCWAPNLFSSWMDCLPSYEGVYEKLRKYAAEHPAHKISLPFDLSPQRHLNSGVVVARVWAYKEFIEKAFNLTNSKAPPYVRKMGWFSNQSIIAALYLDLITWEVERDVFSMPMDERQAARSPYGMRAGFIGLDFANSFSGTGEVTFLYVSEIRVEHWMKYLPRAGSEHSHSHNMTDFWDLASFTDSLYRRAYAAHGEAIFTRLAVPRWVGGKRATNKTHITLTPPLWAIKLRPINTVNHTTCNSYPAICHTPGIVKGYTKLMQMENGAVVARWFLPIVHNRMAKCQAMEYLASVPLFLSTKNSIIRDSYDAQCGFPFERTVRKVRDLRDSLLF